MMFRKKRRGKSGTTHLKLISCNQFNSSQSDVMSALPLENLQGLIAKHTTLAEEAKRSGDRIVAEYHFQCVDHYTRLLTPEKNRNLSQR